MVYCLGPNSDGRTARDSRAMPKMSALASPASMTPGPTLLVRPRVMKAPPMTPNLTSMVAGYHGAEPLAGRSRGDAVARSRLRRARYRYGNGECALRPAILSESFQPAG